MAATLGAMPPWLAPETEFGEPVTPGAPPGASVEAPQESQNFTPSANWEPHFEQIAIMYSSHVTTDKNLVLGAPACTWRCAGEGELLFALIHCSPILPDLAEGVNRQVLPAFCQFWRNAEGRLAGIWRPARQCARSGAVLRLAGHEKAGAGQKPGSKPPWRRAVLSRLGRFRSSGWGRRRHRVRKCERVTRNLVTWPSRC